jgi:hypothetical protein
MNSDVVLKSGAKEIMETCSMNIVPGSRARETFTGSKRMCGSRRIPNVGVAATLSKVVSDAMTTFTDLSIQCPMIGGSTREWTKNGMSRVFFKASEVSNS